MKIIYGNKGFSLIEVLISILIFTISLFAIIPLLFTAVNVDNDALLKVTAQKMMTETVDDMMAHPNLTNCTCTEGVVTDGACLAGTCTADRNGNKTINANIIERDFTIADMIALPSSLETVPPALKIITVEVRYTQGNENRTLSTMARKGF